MSEPQQRPVRVRRSPRIGVFLALGAVLGLLAALVVVTITPADPDVPTPQALGFIALLLAPLGALLTGAVALVLDAVGERRARTVTIEAERIRSDAPATGPEDPTEPDVEPDADSDRPDPER